MFTWRRRTEQDVAQEAVAASNMPTHPEISLASLLTLQEDREQALRDYKVTIEYKHLKAHAPGGVYLVPSMDDLRCFYGIIFVRRGLYTNGIFKFQLTLPPEYNSMDSHPKITFFSYVYNPHVNPATMELDVQAAYPTWDCTKHYMVTVLTFLKKIFYSKTFKDARAHPQARDLCESDPDEYRRQIEACVRDSQRDVFLNQDDSTARFTDEEISHKVLRDLLKANVKDPQAVDKKTILSIVEKASRS
jgi:ubiquitin-protein ligase